MSPLRSFLKPWTRRGPTAAASGSSHSPERVVLYRDLQEMSGPAASQEKIGEIARTAVKLASLGPRLAALAETTEAQANAQARTAAQIATVTSRLADTLTSVVSRLEGAAGNVHDAMRDIVRIAEQTRLISLNASIEAARGGASTVGRLRWWPTKSKNWPTKPASRPG